MTSLVLNVQSQEFAKLTDGSLVAFDSYLDAIQYAKQATRIRLSPIGGRFMEVSRHALGGRIRERLESSKLSFYKRDEKNRWTLDRVECGTSHQIDTRN